MTFTRIHLVSDDMGTTVGLGSERFINCAICRVELNWENYTKWRLHIIHWMAVNWTRTAGRGRTLAILEVAEIQQGAEIAPTPRYLYSGAHRYSAACVLGEMIRHEHVKMGGGRGNHPGVAPIWIENTRGDMSLQSATVTFISCTTQGRMRPDEVHAMATLRS